MKNKLKRFVLTSHNTIYEVVDKKVLPIGLRDNYIKTSDNILDLVEIGDLVVGQSYIYVSEVTEINNKEIGVFNYLFWKSEITAFWKKQSNGDYKKYEVKKWIKIFLMKH